MSELTGRGAGWTDERGTSQEGRRRLAASRERAGNTGSDPIDPAAAAELRRLVAEVLAEVLPGLSTGQAPWQSSSRMNVPSIPEVADEWHIHPAPAGGTPAGRQPSGAPATVLTAGGVP